MTTRGRVRALDGLRAVACLAVIMFHFGVPGSRGGWLGVDAFFVLSGYLITKLLRSELQGTGTVNLQSFWVRRLARVGPALVVSVIAAVLFSKFLDLDHVERVTPMAAGLALASGANIYRGIGGNLGILTPTWSLSVEEQFYLLWPVLMIVFLRNKKKFLCGCLCLGGLSLLMAFIDLGGGHRNNPHVLAWELLAGCALAELPLHRVPSRALANGGAVGLLTLMLVGNFFSSNHTMEVVLSVGAVGATAAFIAGTSCGQESLAAKISCTAWFAWIGRISYPAYLLHVPLWVAFAHHFPAPDGIWLPRIAVMIAMVLAASVIVHHGIEIPVQRWARRRTTQPDTRVIDVRPARQPSSA